ncbi:MAG: SLBB domain-containing protein [Phenylobacterium sp.]
MIELSLLRLALFGALLLAAPIAASAQVQPSPAQAAPPAAAATTPQSTAVDSSYLLGPGDVVEIGLVGRADFGSRARVSTDGTILLPMIGAIPAAQRTVLQLADDVRQALIKGGFYADPVVRTEVVGINSRYVTVLGAVGSPGLLPLDRNYHLSEILARVGGRSGSGADFILLTPTGGGATQRYSIAQLASGAPDKDPVVHNGDKIYIPTVENEVFYISGQVNSPGAFPVTEGMTVRMAIAKGGGVNENGSEKKVKIVRDGKPLKGVKLEDPVKVGDIVTIGERLF